MKLKKAILNELCEWNLSTCDEVWIRSDLAKTLSKVVKRHYKQKKALKKQKKADGTNRIAMLADKLSRLTMRVYELEGKALKAKD